MVSKVPTSPVIFPCCSNSSPSVSVVPSCTDGTVADVVTD